MKRIKYGELCFSVITFRNYGTEKSSEVLESTWNVISLKLSVAVFGVARIKRFVNFDVCVLVNG